MEATAYLAFRVRAASVGSGKPYGKSLETGGDITYLVSSPGPPSKCRASEHPRLGLKLQKFYSPP